MNMDEHWIRWPKLPATADREANRFAERIMAQDASITSVVVEIEPVAAELDGLVTRRANCARLTAKRAAL